MPEPKYSNGQKVKIIYSKNELGHSKYPSLDNHIGKEGIIADNAYLGIKPLPNIDALGLDEDNYVYFINTGEESLLGIFEEMIQPI